jgi:hypothetical protein
MEPFQIQFKKLIGCAKYQKAICKTALKEIAIISSKALLWNPYMPPIFILQEKYLMLMAVAEDIQKVHAICVKCGSPANHSHRLTASDQLVVLGDKDAYEPLCRHCYNAAIQAEKSE